MGKNKKKAPVAKAEEPKPEAKEEPKAEQKQEVKAAAIEETKQAPKKEEPKRTENVRVKEATAKGEYKDDQKFIGGEWKF